MGTSPVCCCERNKNDGDQTNIDKEISSKILESSPDKIKDVKSEKNSKKKPLLLQMKELLKKTFIFFLKVLN